MQDKTKCPPGLITVGDFAKEFCVTSATVRRWAQLGEIKSIRIGAKMWIPQAEVERVLTPK
jgi:excisionase family DNA binding protein